MVATAPPRLFWRQRWPELKFMIFVFLCDHTDGTPFDLEDYAEAMGVRMLDVNRVLAELERSGWIDRDGDMITINGGPK